MAIRNEHGSARVAPPRSKDLAAIPALQAERERPRQRDAAGRWVAGNAGGNGRGWKAAISKLVGRDLQGEAAPLAREAWRVYTALLAELPHTGAQVSSLVASRARSAVLSARFAAKAAEFGLDTPAGASALELSMKLDARAERLAISAIDIATRLAAADRRRKPNDVHAAVADHFSAPSGKDPR